MCSILGTLLALAAGSSDVTSNKPFQTDACAAALRALLCTAERRR